MPYYPPHTEGGGTPEPTPTPDLQAVVVQGSKVEESFTAGLFPIEYTLPSGDVTYKATVTSIGVTATMIDSGVESSVALTSSSPGVAWKGADFNEMALLKRGQNTSYAEVEMPSTSGTLALSSEVQEVGDDVTVLDGRVSDINDKYVTLLADYEALLLRVESLESA